MNSMKLEAFSIFNIGEPASICEIPEGTCLLAYRGSIAHGMYIPSTDPSHIDDVDLIGAVIGRTENYLGLSEWGSRGTYEYKRGKWDGVFYEARKMFSLLLQGNPNVLSMLWCEPQHYLYIADAGRLILQNRNMFVGKHVYNAFAGYAHGQLEKMEVRDPVELRQYLAVTAELKRRGAHPNHKGEVFDIPEPTTGVERDCAAWGLDRLLAALAHFQKKGENVGYMGDKRKQLVLEHGYDAKNAAHCIRLLRMCREFMSTGEMLVLRPDASELLEIKRGKWTLEQIKNHARELFEEIRIARDASQLPPEPDRDGAEKLLVGILSVRLWEMKSLPASEGPQ
jgi:RNA repair pathway DNA polymerase beta family